MSVDMILVDGYNLMHAWSALDNLRRTSLEDAREALLALLARYKGMVSPEIWVVFDGCAARDEQADDVGGVHVVYAGKMVSADHVIEKYVHAAVLEGKKVMVVTSDKTEQYMVLGMGALRCSSREFIGKFAKKEAGQQAWLNKNRMRHRRFSTVKDRLSHEALTQLKKRF